MLKKIPMTKQDLLNHLKDTSKDLEELFDLSEINDEMIKKKYISIEEVEHMLFKIYLTSQKRKEEMLNDKI